MSKILRKHDLFLLSIFVACSFFVCLMVGSFSYQLRQTMTTNVYDKNTFSILVNSFGESTTSSQNNDLKLLDFLNEKNISFFLIKETYENVNYVFDNSDRFELDHLLLTGRFFEPSDFTVEKNVSVVGEKKLSEIYYKSENDTAFIMKNGIEYEVVGILGGDAQNHVYLNMAFTQNGLYTFPIQGTYYFNSSESTEEIVRELMFDLNVYDLSVNVSPMKSTLDYIVDMVNEYKIILIILVVSILAILFNAINATHYWLLVKKEELVVRLLVGSTKSRLTCKVIGDFSKIVVFAFVIAVMITKAVQLTFSVNFLVNEMIAIIISLIIVMFLGVIIVSYSLFQFYKSDLVGRIGEI